MAKYNKWMFTLCVEDPDHDLDKFRRRPTCRGFDNEYIMIQVVGFRVECVKVCFSMLISFSFVCWFVSFVICEMVKMMMVWTVATTGNTNRATQTPYSCDQGEGNCAILCIKHHIPYGG